MTAFAYLNNDVSSCKMSEKKNIQEKKTGDNDKIIVKGSFMDIMKAVVKDADKKSAKKK